MFSVQNHQYLMLIYILYFKHQVQVIVKFLIILILMLILALYLEYDLLFVSLI